VHAGSKGLSCSRHDRRALCFGAWNRLDTIKVGVLHSLSGTMAISETVLKDTVLMAIDEINAKGGLLGKKLEPVVVDPASNWPLFAEKAKQLITQDKVAAVFGCWTSVSRKSVLPVFEENNSPALLPRAVRRRRAQQERLLHRCRAQPAGHSRGGIPDEQGRRQRQALGAAGHRLRLPAHHQQDPARVPEGQGRGRGRHHGGVHPLRPFSDYQTIIAKIKKFAGEGKKTAVVSTINGDSNVPFYKELGNQGLKATDVPVVAFSVGEEELRGVDTKPLVGHLAAWNYFMSSRARPTPPSSRSGATTPRPRAWPATRTSR
jgi:urea transport system substrate-binding protein